MIKIENADTYGWEAAIRGMRNPMNSWDKSDSYHGSDEARKQIGYIIGPNDMALMLKLCHAGTDHRKFMRMIHVSADVTAPLYWWKEYDTYKVGTVANSCSTMHKLGSKKFELDDFSHDYMDPIGERILKYWIDDLNDLRDLYISTNEKKIWYSMIQLLPSSYNQRRTIDLNYEVLTNIYHARLHHKLDEWHRFCDWIRSLPMSDLILQSNGNYI